MGSFNEKIIADQSRKRRPLAERVRRGVCLLNAAQYEEAIAELDAGQDVPHNVDPLKSYLATCMGDPTKTGPRDNSIIRLREAIAADPESPVLHFRLGALLIDAGRLDEAELRFTQVLSISRDHVEAIVCLALVHQRRGESGQSVSLLQRAQAIRPGDPRIALLLARAAKECKKQGAAIDLCVLVTND